MRKRVLVGGLLLFTCVGLLGLWLGWSTPPTAPLHRLSPAVSSLPLWNLQEGQQLDFELDYRGELLAEAPGTAVMQTAVEGRLILTVLDTSASSYGVWLAIEVPPHVMAQLPAVSQKALAAAFRRGVAARMDRRGWQLVLETEGLEPTAAQFWQNLAERARLIAPESASDRYALSENWGAFRGVARYTYEPLVLHKTFDGQGSDGERLTGSGEMRWDEAGQHMRSLLGQSEEHLLLGSQKMLSRTRISLSWQGQTQLSQQELKTRREPRSPPATEDDDGIAAIQRHALGGRDLKDIWQAFSTITQASAVPQELYLQLKAWIYLYPTRLDELLQRLEGQPHEAPVLRAAIKALAAVAHPAAQATLVELMKSSSDPAVVARIGTSLGLMPQTTVETQKALEQQLEQARDPQLNRTLALALGAAGGQLQRAGAEARAAQIEQVAWARLDQLGPKEVATGLAMIGNSGPRQLDRLEAFLHDADPAIRGEAAWALRFAPDPSIPQRLLQLFRQESEAAVRSQILRAMALRVVDAAWQQAMANWVTLEMSDAERLALARVLNKQTGGGEELWTPLLAGARDSALRQQMVQLRDLSRQQAAQL